MSHQIVCSQVGKSYAGKANKGVTVREVEGTLQEGFQSMEALFQKGAAALESVKYIAITLRKLPTVDINIPTVRPLSCLLTDKITGAMLPQQGQSLQLFV